MQELQLDLAVGSAVHVVAECEAEQVEVQVMVGLFVLDELEDVPQAAQPGHEFGPGRRRERQERLLQRVVQFDVEDVVRITEPDAAR